MWCVAAVEIALVGLIEDSLLPGERRRFGNVQNNAKQWQGLEAGAEVAVVGVASRVELPGFVKGRYATLAKVESVGEQLVVLGLSRVKIISAKGSESPYKAHVEPVEDPRQSSSVQASLTRLGQVLGRGAVPQKLGNAPAEEALSALMRVLGSEAQLRDLMRHPLPEAALRLADELQKIQPAEEAAVTLEVGYRVLAEAPEITPALRHRLWSQCVEIMRRLDVYDPSQGDDDNDISKLERKLTQAGLPPAANEVAKRELRMLRQMKPDHHDYSLYVQHLELMAKLRWHPETLPTVDLTQVEAILDREHSGLAKPKRRVLEYLAMRGLGGQGGTTVLCLAGPPGVGKTTIARAIAEALGRKFVRIALGGVHDESELRGHRKSFVAAAPGRIISGIAATNSAAPLVLLDELDKVGADRGRSPVGALHEILDPEQSTHFYDNFLACPYDLSHVFFICTANDLSALPMTLRDRLEVVQLEGYTVPEKLHIAETHLARRLAQDSGLPAPIPVDHPLLGKLIENYTREAGVRELQRVLGKFYRDRALKLFKAGTEAQKKAALSPLTAEEVTEILGTPRYFHDDVPAELPVGVAHGLAVSGEGGSVLTIEVTAGQGKGPLQLTGKLGEVMKESAHAAKSCLWRARAKYGIEDQQFLKALHIHVPEGAIPKDGPSAGLALILALYSALTQKSLPGTLVASGEITLTGKILAVGGITAKLLAAERAGANLALIPLANRSDIPQDLKLRVVCVQTVDEALAALA